MWSRFMPTVTSLLSVCNVSATKRPTGRICSISAGVRNSIMGILSHFSRVGTILAYRAGNVPIRDTCGTPDVWQNRSLCRDRCARRRPGCDSAAGESRFRLTRPTTPPSLFPWKWSTRGGHRERFIMNIIDALDAASLRSDIPEFGPGDTVKVHVNIVEGNRSRVQVFQGVVIGRQGSGLRETFTVRKISFQVGVQRMFPVHSPIIDKIEVMTRGDVRRAKIYYLRGLTGKKARIREKRTNNA